MLASVLQGQAATQRTMLGTRGHQEPSSSLKNQPKLTLNPKPFPDISNSDFSLFTAKNLERVTIDVSLLSHLHTP